MGRFVRIIDRITNFFAAIAGIIMILGVALILTEIIARSFFNRTTYITDEYTAYFMAAMPLGSLIIMLQFVAEIARTILKFRTGDIDEEDTEAHALGH